MRVSLQIAGALAVVNQNALLRQQRVISADADPHKLQLGDIYQSPNLPDDDSRVDCEGQWDVTTECRPCAEEIRTFTIHRAAANGGEQCEHEQGDTRTRKCDCDCEGSWVPDKAGCPMCESVQLVYRIERAQVGSGAQCPEKEGETATRQCDCDCEGDWHKLRECSMAADDCGVETLEYRVHRHKVGNGAECLSPKQGDQKVGMQCQCDIDCEGSFNVKKQCQNCDPGIKIYQQSKKKKGNGIDCPFSDGYEKEDGSCGCRVDCVGAWISEGECDCNTGKQPMRFKVDVEQKGTGLHCDGQDGEQKEKECECPEEATTQSPEEAETEASKKELEEEGVPKTTEDEIEQGEAKVDINAAEDAVAKEVQGSLMQRRLKKTALPKSPVATSLVQHGRERQPTDAERAAAALQRVKDNSGYCSGEWLLLSECVPCSEAEEMYEAAEHELDECPHKNGSKRKRLCDCDCEGVWLREKDECPPCSTVKLTFAVTRAQVGAGSECEADHGKVSTEVCPCDCDGSWEITKPCSNCGKSEVEFVIKNPGFTGKPCEDQDGDTKEGPKCECNRDCIGAWETTKDCAGCQTGLQSYRYLQQPEGSGETCEFKEGELRELPKCGCYNDR